MQPYSLNLRAELILLTSAMRKPLSDYVVAFDLDDTLYKEIEFLKSGYYHIALTLCDNAEDASVLAKSMYDWYNAKCNVFEKAIEATGSTCDISSLLAIYREHIPDITLPHGSKECLRTLKAYGATLALITDGRTLTQRNKIRALGLDRIIPAHNIIISEEFGSEKPCAANYEVIEQRNPGKKYCYVGDNVIKDFVTANSRGWLTTGLRDNGFNVHRQDAECRPEYQPSIWIDSLDELPDTIIRADFRPSQPQL